MSFAIASAAKCVDVLLKQDLPKEFYTPVLLQVANFVDAAAIRTLLDRGAVVDAPDPTGHTALAYVAGSDVASVDAAKLLIERGANVNSKSTHANSGDTGMSILDSREIGCAAKIGPGDRAAGSRPERRVRLRRPSEPDAASRSVSSGRDSDQPAAAAACRRWIHREVRVRVLCHNDSFTAMAIGA